MSKQKSTMGTVDDSDFITKVTQSEKPVLVFFYADWSGPSHKMNPVVGNVAVEFSDALAVYSANADSCKDTIARLGIRRAPTCVLFVDGTLVGSRFGFQTQENLSKFVSEVISK